MMTASRRDFLKMLSIASTVTIVDTCIPKPLFAHIPPTSLTETRLLMGTFVTITAVHHSTTLLEEALEKTFETITQKETIYSNFNSSSPLSILNTQGKLLDAPEELQQLIQHSIYIEKITSGTFNITVKPVLDLLQSYKNPTGNLVIDPKDFNEVVKLIGSSQITIKDKLIQFYKQDMGVTLDGIAKGYICDCASTTLTDYGIHNHLVNAGGDIIAKGHNASRLPWTVAIENPTKKGKYPEFVRLNNCAIATSGSYEHYFDAQHNYHHLIDPRSGKSPSKIQSISVVAPTVMEADALATAISIMDPVTAIPFIENLPGRECYLLDCSGIKRYSSKWSTVSIY